LNQSNQKQLSAFKLAMMAIIAIDMLKNIPSHVQYGPSLIFYYCFAMLVFFLPSALVSAEMATSFPKTGGAYIWIREAFGKPIAFMAIWMQWLLNVTWAPTILIFMVITASYYISPNYFEAHKLQLLASVLSVFWISVALIANGIKTSSYISVFSAIVGVILPMISFVILGAFWLLNGHLQTSDFTWSLPNFELNANYLRLLLPLLLSFMGMEMIAVHADDVKNPQKSYPKALIIASFSIFCMVIPASIAIMLVMPKDQIAFTTGVVESFKHFLIAFHLSSYLPIVIFMLIVGSFGIFYTWLLTISRYLLSATEDGALPKIFKFKNKNNMPVMLLIFQGIAFSALTSFLILMPSIEQAFWLMTVACTQFGLMFYILLFGAAIKLRLSRPDIHRPFKVGKSPFLIVAMSSIAIIVCFLSIIFGFIPPPHIQTEDIFRYKAYLILVMAVGLGAGLLIFIYQSFKRSQSAPIKYSLENK